MASATQRTFRYFTALLVLFAALVTRANGTDHCVVLQYHHISEETPGIVSVTPEQFQQHLDYFLLNDHNVLPLLEVVDRLKNGDPLPERCVALTIDGAYLSTYAEAYPRVRRYQFPLTVFVSTARVDKEKGDRLSWSQMREMQGQRISFQNHSHSHAHLIRRLDGESQDDWEQRVAADIQFAQNRLKTELGAVPTLFAYPYGEFNPALRQIIESMGLIGFGQHPGPLWRQADFGALPRFPMASLSARMRSFPSKINSRPLPITGAFPDDPVVPLDEWSPSLTLVFRPDVDNAQQLKCYLNGSPRIDYVWLEQPAGAVVLTPRGRLNIGRNRVHCTLPDTDSGQIAWYSHNWIRRREDGSWYRESK